MSNQPEPVSGDAGGTDAASARPARPDATIWTPAGRVDRFGVVLLLIALTVVVDCSGLTAGWAGVLSTALGAATLAFVFTAADARPTIVRLVRVAALLAVVLAATAVVAGDMGRVSILVNATGAALAIAAPIVIARRLLRQPVITVHTVLGGLCLYLLIGLFFVYVFAFVNDAAGPFFVQTTTAGGADFVYFSYITLATVGYGDLTPHADAARMLAATEGITGQLFLVTVLAFFLGNLGARRSAFRDGIEQAD
ncbi:MAG: potassium channel family protein [Candidatus Limnocylindrales bacterium]